MRFSLGDLKFRFRSYVCSRGPHMGALIFGYLARGGDLFDSSGKFRYLHPQEKKHLIGCLLIIREGASQSSSHRDSTWAP